MFKRIAAISFIFASTSIAWFILGATIYSRTFASDSRLRDRVVSAWGAPHEQSPPAAAYHRMVTRMVESTEDNKKFVRTVQDRVAHPLPLERSRIDVALDLEHRQKGLLWYSTYKVAFSGLYTFRNPSSQEELVTFTFNFPAAKAIYDDLSVEVDGVPLSLSNLQTAAAGTARLPAGKIAVLSLAYRSQGLDSWNYKFGGDVAQVRDFLLTLNTNFKDFDFGEDTLAATEKQETPRGSKLTWSYKNLVSGY
jgi:hypothetical protein